MKPFDPDDFRVFKERHHTVISPTTVDILTLMGNKGMNMPEALTVLAFAAAHLIAQSGQPEVMSEFFGGVLKDARPHAEAFRGQS